MRSDGRQGKSLEKERGGISSGTCISEEGPARVNVRLGLTGGGRGGEKQNQLLLALKGGTELSQGGCQGISLHRWELRKEESAKGPPVQRRGDSERGSPKERK